MRVINDIIVHCSANKASSKITAADIKADHIHNRHWRDVGYHYIIDQEGNVTKGRPQSQPGAHCIYHNAHSIGVCYIGGLDEDCKPADTRTPAQKQAMLKLITTLVKLYRCDVHGHRDYNKSKACPCFDAHAEYHNLYTQLVIIG